ncbi:hypothetical protein QOT17_001037 [Balamuthia mandrillaris]
MYNAYFLCGLTLSSQQSYAEVVGSAPWCDIITVERNFPPTALQLVHQAWNTGRKKWQRNKGYVGRITPGGHGPKIHMALPVYSKIGAVEGRSIVVSSKDLKKEQVCERIFKLGLKHVRVWKVGEKNGTQHWGVTLETAKAAEDIIAERARLYAFTHQENVGTVALDSSLELSGIMLAEEEYHGTANWSDIVEEEGEETQ